MTDDDVVPMIKPVQLEKISQDGSKKSRYDVVLLEMTLCQYYGNRTSNDTAVILFIY